MIAKSEWFEMKGNYFYHDIAVPYFGGTVCDEQWIIIKNDENKKMRDVNCLSDKNRLLLSVGLLIALA